MKKVKPVHPLLLALFPTLFLYSHNTNDYALAVTIVPLLVSLSLALLCWLLFGLIFRNLIKGALGGSFFVLLFFSYGHAYDLLWYVFAVRPFTCGADKVLTPVFGLLLLIFLVWLFFTRRKLLLLTRWANYVAVILLIVPVITIGSATISSPSSSTTNSDQQQENTPGTATTTADSPDIYYIILDAFARADVLADLYNLPDSKLYQYLEQRGFYVAHRSGSNYCQTALSLASSLNYKYLDPAEDGFDSDSKDRTPLTGKIVNNRVSTYLRERGYTTVSFATGYAPSTLRNADIFLDPVGRTWFLDEFQSGLVQTTALPYLVPEIYQLPFTIGGLSHPQADARRKMLRRTISLLGEMPRRTSPKFVFAHLVTPHPPFLFNARGGAIYPRGVFHLADGNALIGRYIQKREDYISLYRNQLIYIESLIITMIEDILANSSRPPIIVLQADHGPGAYLDWNSSTETNMRERLSILNAYYLPQGGDSLLYETITPVNTFRLIFNHYFGEKLELLPDESYFSLWNKPYYFIPVGREIKRSEER